eukprot:symbB.v1.2.021663.t1/scaffold1886.1/size97136/2
MVNAKHQLDKARSLAAQYVDSLGGIPKMSGGSLIDYAWALVALDLVREFEADFVAAMSETFNRTPPQNRIPLLKLFDVLCALELEYKDLKVQVPSSWKNACDDADRYEMDRLESSRLHNEVMMRFDQLRGSSKGVRWKLQMQRNSSCGPYRVDMLDQDTKIAVDLEIVSWPTARHLKHRLLEAQGYRMVNLQYWDWRRARTEEDQNLFLEREVDAFMVQGKKLPLRYANAALRGQSWMASLQLLRSVQVWRFRPNTVSFNSCLRTWPWHRGLLMVMARAMVEADVITCNTAMAADPWPNALMLLDGFRRSRLQADTITFNSLLSRVWILAGSLLQMRGLCLETNLVSYNAGIHAWEGDWPMSLHSLMEVPDPDIISFGSSISGCGKAAEWQRAVHLMFQLPSRRLRVNAVAMNSAIAAGPWYFSSCLLEATVYSSLPTVVSYNAMAASCERFGLWPYTLNVLESLVAKSFKVSPVLCNTAISACETGGAWSTAEALLAAMPHPDIISFNAALSANGESQWHRSLRLLERLLCRDLEASVVTYNAAIAASGWARGLGLLPVLADEVTCNTVINTCNTWQQATALLGVMKDGRCQSNAISCGTMVSQCREFWARALYLLEMEQDINEVACSAVISCCEQGDEWRQALAVLLQMQERTLLANAIAINAAISACEKCKRWKEAIALLDLLQTQRQDDVADVVSVEVYTRAEESAEKDSRLEVPAKGKGRRTLTKQSGNIQSCLSSAFSFLHTAKSHRDAPFTALEMVEQELVTEDEFANRDEMGLQPLTDTTETEDAAFWKYVRLLLMFIPPLGLGFAAATWAVSVFLLGGKNIIEAKFSFIHQYQLGYVFLAVWIVSYTRTFLSILANSARAAARLDRPDQHVYKVMAASGALKDSPYVLMVNTGPVGRFNRAQRAAYNMDESIPLMLINTVLSSSIFGPVILLPLLLYCYGRISFGVKYKGSLKKRGAGFTPAIIGEKWMEGLVLFSAIMGLF